MNQQCCLFNCHYTLQAGRLDCTKHEPLRLASLSLAKWKFARLSSVIGENRTKPRQRCKKTSLKSNFSVSSNKIYRVLEVEVLLKFIFYLFLLYIKSNP